MSITRIFYSLFSLLLLFVFSTQLLYASVDSDIKWLIKKYGLSNAKIGIAVQRTKSGKWLYEYNSDSLYLPASNNKVFTAVGALLTLPSNFKFNTTVYYDEQDLNNHTLNGNLYIKFTGDPSLTSSGLNKLIQQIYQKGIYKIKGDIIAIANTFTGEYYPVGWSETDKDYCFAAPASSMNLNRNCIIIAVQSAGGSKTKIKKISNTDHIEIQNHLKFVSNTKAKACGFNPSMDSYNILVLKGCLPKRGEWRLKFAIANPALKTLQEIGDSLHENNIAYTGDLKIGTLPSGLTELTYVCSGTRNYLLKHMLQHSDNLYAESLARSVGQEVRGSGTIQSGVACITNQIHTQLGMETDENLVMKDGSGLSHSDSVSPKFMAEFLTETFNNKKIGRIFYNALPVSGISGTIAYRMNKDGLLGKVHAKTGTLDDSSTLSGYLLTKRVHRLSFSIMVNDLKRSQRKDARKFQDAVVKVFYQNL